MSHANVTVTRTVTTTHPHAIFLNVGYLKSAAGLLKIAQLVILCGNVFSLPFLRINCVNFILQILGAIVIGVILCKEEYYDGRMENPANWILRYRYYLHSQEATLFMLVMACTFFICTFILLLSCIFSLSTGGLISKTLYVSKKNSISKMLCNILKKNNLIEITFHLQCYRSSFITYLQQFYCSLHRWWRLLK